MTTVLVWWQEAVRSRTHICIGLLNPSCPPLVASTHKIVCVAIVLRPVAGFPVVVPCEHSQLLVNCEILSVIHPDVCCITAT